MKSVSNDILPKKRIFIELYPNDVFVFNNNVCKKILTTEGKDSAVTLPCYEHINVCDTQEVEYLEKYMPLKDNL